MIIPERLWRPSGKDLLTDFNPQAYCNFQNDIAMLALLQQGIPAVPADKILIVTSIVLLAVGGGAQTAGRTTMDIVDPVLNIIGRVLDSGDVSRTRDPAATLNPAQVLLQTTGSPICVLVTGQKLVASASFSAAVAANSLQVSVCGVIAPRGNWQLGG